MRTITITLSDDDEKLLAHDILDPDRWLKDAFAGKIAACQKRLLADGEKLLRDDPAVSAIPTDRGALQSMILAHPGYRDRVARDAEALAESERARVVAERKREAADE